MIAIISDVHGNYSALKAVLEDADTLGCEAGISLGDVAGYYCMINECIDLIRARPITCIRGNHDHYLATRSCCPRSRSANICLQYQQEVVTLSNREWLASLPLTLMIDDLSAVHGGWNDPLDEYMDRCTPEYFSKLPGRNFVSGHTHVQALCDCGTAIYCNPGAVGQPRDGDPRAAYAIFDQGRFSLRRVAYEIDSIADAMQRTGFERRIYENLYAGTQIGGRVMGTTMRGIDG
jgi:predicted phosphodiesterase